MQIRVDLSKMVVEAYVVAKTAAREEASYAYFRVVLQGSVSLRQRW